MSNNFGLGRGLASLIPKKNNTRTDADKMRANINMKQVDNEENNRVIEVEIEKITPNPYQPRLGFNEDKLKELTNSIKIHGIIQPLMVSRKGDSFELIAGERRFQAAKKAGLGKVPVIIRDVGEKEKLELAIVENIQRHDINNIEEARAYKKLHDKFQMSQEEIALKVGKNRSTVANKMRLLNLPVEIQRAIIEGKITEGHAKAILAIENSEKQRALFEMIIKNNLTVRQAEDKTKEISVRSHNRIINIDPEMKELENRLTGIFGTKVEIKKSGGGGKIIVNYYSKEELNNILNKISNS